MRLLIVASAALALLCTPALAGQMGSHPLERTTSREGAREPENQTVRRIVENDAPVSLPADGKQRVACTTKEQLQDITSQATFAEAQDKIRRYVSFQDDGGDPPCAVFDWGQGTVTEAVLLPHTFTFPSGTEYRLYALHVVFPKVEHCTGACTPSFWVLWQEPVT